MVKRRILQALCMLAVLAPLCVFYVLGRPTIGSGPSAKALEKIKALPYVTRTRPSAKHRSKTRVQRHLPHLAHQGLNFYNYESDSNAQLVDMSGKVLHVWDAGELIFDHAELLPDGSVLGLSQEGGYVFKLGFDSRVVWKTKIGAHHDLDVALNGDILVLTEGGVHLKQLHPRRPTIENWIQVLSAGGKAKGRVPLSRLLLSSGIPLERMKAVMARNVEEEGQGDGFDAFHANTIEVLRKDVLTADQQLLRKGQVLICLRHLNLVCVVDMKSERIVWSWGMDELDRPHQPSMLDNGDVLIFDNGSRRGFSRVLEVDPREGKIRWQYAAHPREDFFTAASGGCQRLPNGNTLITESMTGRIFEVTRDGEVVWEFFSPLFNHKKERKAIWRMTRYSDQHRYPVLRRFVKPDSSQPKPQQSR